MRGGEHVPGMREYQIEVPASVDVKTIRAKLGMTQRVFAQTFGFPLRTLASWEGKERQPEKAARILLQMIEKDAVAVLKCAQVNKVTFVQHP